MSPPTKQRTPWWVWPVSIAFWLGVGMAVGWVSQVGRTSPCGVTTITCAPSGNGSVTGP